MATSGVKRMGYAEYAEIPADGNRHEVIDGVWFMTPSPEVLHQRVSRNLERVLDSHVLKDGLGEVLNAPIDVVLSEHDIVQPDLVFIAQARGHIVKLKNIQGAPDLVVEILSPSTASIDRTEKRDLYERAGVREYWIVDPETRTFVLHEFGSPRRTRVYKDGQSFESDVLAGLTVRLSAVF